MTPSLRELHPGRLWTVDEPFAKAGIELGARMTVLKLPNGGLWLHSPIALTEALKRQLEALGPVQHLLSPNAFHYMGLEDAKGAFPAARVYSMAGTLRSIKIKPDEQLGDHVALAWRGELEQVIVRGEQVAKYEEAVFFDPVSRTLILTDLCFNLGPGRSGYTRMMARAMGVYGRPAPSKLVKFYLKDRKLVRETIQKILKWDFDRIVLSHGDIVERGGKQHFRDAFDWL
jgi:hypothetical protein